jgi:hypothetical protein
LIRAVDSREELLSRAVVNVREQFKFGLRHLRSQCGRGHASDWR